MAYLNPRYTTEWYTVNKPAFATRKKHAWMSGVADSHCLNCESFGWSKNCLKFKNLFVNKLKIKANKRATGSLKVFVPLLVGIILVVNEPLWPVVRDQGVEENKGIPGQSRISPKPLGTLNAANLKLKQSLLAIAKIDAPPNRRK